MLYDNIESDARYLSWMITWKIFRLDFLRFSRIPWRMLLYILLRIFLGFLNQIQDVAVYVELEFS